MMKPLLTAFLLLSASTCRGQTQGGAPPAPTTVPAAASVDIALCPQVCTNYRNHHCPAGNPTDKGVPCETVCQEAIVTGLVRWNMACRTVAPSCDAAEACER